ncbi:Protein disabled [Portunus trituberculatus]|uniref:Protein disabled n=1 Tax=Portunus trituberculatus TaxID=210409 RepID=A0A5B7GB34_PORTR|nr:Protein disabled [Portunus trituberculatus]
MAQDMTDTRAFGYIFGSPDSGHKFFGIKSEKAASQVVIAMRDLFQGLDCPTTLSFPVFCVKIKVKEMRRADHHLSMKGNGKQIKQIS